MLCFVQKRSAVLAMDDLVNVCSNFFTMAEVESATLLLKDRCVPEKRLWYQNIKVLIKTNDKRQCLTSLKCAGRRGKVANVLRARSSSSSPVERITT